MFLSLRSHIRWSKVRCNSNTNSAFDIWLYGFFYPSNNLNLIDNCRMLITFLDSEAVRSAPHRKSQNLSMQLSLHKKSWKNLPHHSNCHQHQESVWYIRAIDREACRIDDVMVEKFLLLRGVTLFSFDNSRERCGIIFDGDCWTFGWRSLSQFHCLPKQMEKVKGRILNGG